ncbi:MAG: Hsp20/alpha crystallin family protein [Fischerella sp.]|jgi:HSP20 family protein|uniref:Hsp20/alpha crystallin family protein n=1 Tax=Fischerella sp. TaxID=1191 RepID=UPI00182E1A43|nr:Hsp20/alpha crystallin family protein [Fischerella sp.]NWF61963.1 Hsp20/alpha crystallin family protein [Fischerella sp.]
MPITLWRPFRDIERWQPFQEIENLQRQMNRLFDRLMPSGDGGGAGITFVPSAEMEETDDAVHLRLEIPGLEAKDLDVQVMEDSVAISGERKSQTKVEEKGIVRSEFHYGKFERVIPLPTHVQTDKVQAEYKNGILTLTLPKSEEDKRKVVKVKVA